MALRLCFVACALLILAPLAHSAPPVEVGSDLFLSLPRTWKTEWINNDPGVPGSTPADSPAVSLLLTAHPVDPARHLSLSLARTRFSTAAAALSADAETERLLHTVLSLGFAPGPVRATRTLSTQNTPLLTVETTGRNASGEQRVFSETACETRSGTLRLWASRPPADPAGEDEIASVVQSLRIQEDRTPPPSPSPPPRPRPMTAAQLVQEYREALVLVEGVQGVGSGFLCRLGDTTVALTNAHVIAGNRNVRLTNLDGRAFAFDTGAVAVGHDVVKLALGTGDQGAPVPAKPFTLAADLDRRVKIGDAVVVLGNPEGARVVKPEEGVVVGIGPNLSEVNAPFVKGNSGSPIVHCATGQVLGIATYLIERKAGPDGVSVATPGVRRFGYRLDSIKSWEPLQWPRFYAQSAQVEKIETLSGDFIRLVNHANAGAPVDASDYSGTALARAVQAYTDVTRRGDRLSSADRQSAVLRLLADLRSTARSDITAFDDRHAYDYFRRRVQEQARFRDELCAGFTKLINGRR